MITTRRRAMDDPREVPLYRTSEAALYLGMPATTVAQWFYGRKFTERDGRIAWSAPLMEPADRSRRLLSFTNLAEAHVLQATRDRRIPIANVRAALRYATTQIKSRHPLLTQDFYTHQKAMFIKSLSGIVNASQDGQLALDMFDPYLEGLVRDETGRPFRLFPMRANPYSRVMLDMHIASGQPVVTNTGILVQALHDRHGAVKRQ